MSRAHSITPAPPQPQHTHTRGIHCENCRTTTGVCCRESMRCVDQTAETSAKAAMPPSLISQDRGEQRGTCMPLHTRQSPPSGKPLRKV